MVVLYIFDVVRKGGLEAQFAQAGMILRAWSGCGPVEQSVRLCDGHIVDRGMALRHVTIHVKSPIFVAMGAVPLAIRVMVFIAKPHRDLRIPMSSDFLD